LWRPSRTSGRCSHEARQEAKDTGEKPVPKKSAIITQCVVYAQSTAAYHAGFKVDHTGDSYHAGCQALGKEYMHKADRAVVRLLALSPSFPSGKPMNREELFAKAGVLGIMADPGGTFNPDPMEQAFVRFFAREVEDYLRAQGPGGNE
jgi:hypothetical protein